MNTDFPLLYQFFGAYYNQDYDSIFESEEGLISAYVESGDENELLQALYEFDRLLAMNLEEPELGDFITNKLGSACYPGPEADGRAWLLWIRHTIGKQAVETGKL